MKLASYEEGVESGCLAYRRAGSAEGGGSDCFRELLGYIHRYDR